MNRLLDIIIDALTSHLFSLFLLLSTIFGVIWYIVNVFVPLIQQIK